MKNQLLFFTGKTRTETVRISIFLKYLVLFIAVPLCACAWILAGCEVEETEEEDGLSGFDDRDDTFTFDDCAGLCEWSLYCQRNISGTNDPDECTANCQQMLESEDLVWECWLGCGADEIRCDALVECLGDCNSENS